MHNILALNYVEGPIPPISLKNQRYAIFTIPAIGLLGLILLLGLLAACHFMQGRQRKNRASRTAPDDPALRG
jgi:hypothetical protein